MKSFAFFLLFLVRSALASLTVTKDNQQGSLPFTPSWTPTSASLIAGMTPSSFAGNFNEEGSGANVNTLTGGGGLTIGQVPGGGGETCSGNYVTCGNSSGAGSNIVYTLPDSANGYNITNITVYGGWKDGGRDQQAYTVWYATAANPTNFIALTSVNYLPSDSSGLASSTFVSISDSAGGVLVPNVVALEFDFTTPPCENGYCGYAAITVQGTVASPPSGPPVVFAPSENPASAPTGITTGTVVTLTASALGSIPINYQWRTDGGYGGTMTNIPGATGANLVVNTAGYALGTYRYDYVAQNSQGTNTSPAVAIVIAAMVDIGSAAPTPGPNDIAQLLNTSQNDDGINYYTDNGAAYSNWCGQTFTTGNNPMGYLLKTLAWKSAGNGQSFGNSQLYDLYFYSLSADGTQATVIASYQDYSGGTENDWFQWQGLNVPLAPNQVYAYAFGRDASAGGYEHIGDQGGNPYPGGQIVTVPNTTGTGPVTYGMTRNSDATFDLGLTTYNQTAPRALVPAPAFSVYPIYAGMLGSVTLNEVALGADPFAYQWLCNNGAGGALSPVDGATTSNLVINLNGLTAGNYNYAVVVSNAFGFSVSPSFTLNVLGPTAPSVTLDITPALVNTGNVGDAAQYTASFAGTPPISYQWYFNDGFGLVPISTSGIPSAGSNTLTLSNMQLTNDGVYSVVAQNYAGSVTSSVSTLVVMLPTNSLPPAVTVPPVWLQISNSPGTAHLQWAQGTLQQATNLNGPWASIATNLETTNYAVLATNLAAYFRSTVARQPRIVNLYCFCRDQDYRIANSQQVLFNCTTQQVQLFMQANLPATFALQHDALVDTNYQNYFKTQLPTNDEIGAWWEITQTLCQRAGVTWRGTYEWEPTANIDFSCGYTPTERKQLVDAYMSDFQSIYGYYPKTVGSWYIDEVTLQYMQQQYGVVASANCKDQIGTDTYTLWGSYWNQAYYPSKLDSYMPAQTLAGQIDMPVFRLLGSDPIYQYGNFTPGIYTLEPIYPYSGGSPTWVAWYFNAFIKQPSLAFGYTQAGQENSFGWGSMAAGLNRQVTLIAAEAKAGEIQVMTLAQAGEWFRDNYSQTPSTSVVTLDDWQNQGHKAVWYDSRFYRLNVLWTNGAFCIRDLHCFDENMVSPTYSNVLTAAYFNYGTLPVMDSGQWSGNGTNSVGMWPILLPSGSFMIPQGPPLVKELSPTDLSIQQPLVGGGTFSIICTETNVTCTATNGQGQPLSWAWDMVGGAQQTSAVQNVASNSISYIFDPVAADGSTGIGVNYQLQLASGAGSCQQLSNGDIQLSPDSSGKLVMDLGQ
jgi:hypothetical protein